MLSSAQFSGSFGWQDANCAPALQGTRRPIWRNLDAGGFGFDNWIMREGRGKSARWSRIETARRPETGISGFADMDIAKKS
jgi:hypothetical protein